MSKRYEVSSTTGGGISTEKEVREDLNCTFCGCNILDLKHPVLYHDAYDHYFCEDINCIWEMINECYVTEVEEVEKE